MLALLFEKYMEDLEKRDETSEIFSNFLEGMSAAYRETTAPAEVVRDFIAGMTDDYFLKQCHKHLIPNIEPGLM
jgi:dGTPase